MKAGHSSIFAGCLVSAVALTAFGGCGASDDGREIVYKIKKRADVAAPNCKPELVPVPESLSNAVLRDLQTAGGPYEVVVDNLGRPSRSKLLKGVFCEVDKDIDRNPFASIAHFPRTKGGSYYREFFYLKNTRPMSTKAVLAAMERDGYRPAMLKEQIDFSRDHQNKDAGTSEVFALGSVAHYSNGNFVPYTVNEKPKKEGGRSRYEHVWCMSFSMMLSDPYDFEQWKPGSIFLVAKK